MKKLFLFLLIFFGTGIYITHADIQIKAFAPEGVFQTSTTDFYWYADYRANNAFGVTVYDKNGNATALGYTLSGFGQSVTPTDASVYHRTVNIDDYFIIFTMCNYSTYCDNYTTYTVIKKSTATKVASGWLGGSVGGTPSYAFVGDWLIFSTTSGIKTLQLSTGIWTNGNGSTYTNMNGLVSVGGGKVRGASDGVGSYYQSSYSDAGLNHYTIKYIEWAEVDSTTFGISQEFVAFDDVNIIDDYRIFGPYTNGVFLSIATNGPYNFYTDPDTQQNVNYNVISYTKDTWNDSFWKFYNSTVGDPKLFNLFVAYSQFYYIQDPALLPFNYTIGPYVGYEVSATGSIDSVYYVDAGYLYKKTDTTGYIGSIDADSVNTDNTQGGTGTGTIDYDSSIWDWDYNGDGEVGFLNGEVFVGIGNLFKYFFESLLTFFSNIKALIEKLGDSFTDEQKTFSFNFDFDLIPTAKAEYIGEMFNSVDQQAYEQTTLGKINVFIKGFIVFFIFAVGLAVFIGINKKKNG